MTSTAKKYESSHHNLRFACKEGRFIKPCPGTPRYVCCGYQVIQFAQGCSLDCTYCILDHYFDQHAPVLFTNQDKLLRELKEHLATQKNLVRLGTGEFTDSLCFDEFFQVHRDIIRVIEGAPNAVLEIKTKTTNIEPLLNLEHRDRVIISWSLNSDAIAAQEEKGAPDIESRLKAAQSAEAGGYKLAFHFDPIIHHEDWERGYGETIERLFSTVTETSIVYISMGTLRFVPAMREIMKQHGAQYLEGDFIRGYDGKMRYFRPLRTNLYRRILSRLGRYVSVDRVYLCMENSDVWKDVFGIDGMNSALLAQRLDDNCREAFPSLPRRRC
jgi:spore photoproduct lyase